MTVSKTTICFFSFEGDDKSLVERLGDLGTRLKAVGDLINQADDWTNKARDENGQGQRNVTLAEDVIKRANDQLKVRALLMDCIIMLI